MDLTPYPPIDPVEFNDAEAYIHRAAQFLAMVGKNFITQKEDDSNANLGWDPERQCLISRETNHFQLALHLPTFSLDWMHQGHVISYFPVDKTRKKDIYSWLCNQVGTAGFNVKSLKYIEHYEIPEHPVDLGESFRKPSGELIDAWIAQRSNANIILTSLNNMVGKESEVRIWPHHFDTGTYYSYGDDKALGAGWAIGDEMSNYPYLYIYPWQKDKEIDLDDAPELSMGEWETGKWRGAILSAKQLQNLPDSGTHVSGFLETVIPHLKKTLSI